MIPVEEVHCLGSWLTVALGYVRQLLRKVGAVQTQVTAITVNEHTSGYLGRLQKKVKKIAMDDGHHHVVSIDGSTMAMTSIYN